MSKRDKKTNNYIRNVQRTTQKTNDDEQFGDTKGVIRSRKSKDRQYNGQKKEDKQRSTKYYTEN
jgi:hypothetical protein